jgi:hypothetical protein
MTVYDYAFSPKETIHLVRQEDVYVVGAEKTLCGQPLTADWWMGDETMSGLVATCGRCRQIAHLPQART